MASCMECIHFNPCNLHGKIIVEKPTEGNDWGLHNNVENECKYFTSTADVAEVKHGHFVRNERNIPKMREFHEKGKALSMSEKSIFYTCSECGEWISLSQKYCSECGAKMDVPDTNDGKKGETYEKSKM